MGKLTSPLLIILLLFTAPLFSESGYGLLNIPTGIREAALGMNGITLCEDSFSAVNNPGSLPLLKNSAGFNYKGWYADTTIMQVAANYGTSGMGYFSIGFNSLSVSFDEYDIAGKVVGELTPSTSLIQVGYGRDLSGIVPKLTAGASVNIVMDSLDEEQSSTGFGVNLGAVYKLGLDLAGMNFPIDTGLAVNNIGASSSYEDFSASLPLHLLLGANIHLPWFGLYVPIETGLKAGAFTMALGVGDKYEIIPDLALEGFIGLPVTDDLKTLAMGGGVNYAIAGRVIKVLAAFEMLKVENSINVGLILNY